MAYYRARFDTVMAVSIITCAAVVLVAALSIVICLGWWALQHV